MDEKTIFNALDADMTKALEHAQSEFSKLHTGKASASMVENLAIESYGSTMRLMDVAAITTPDMRTIQIQPWDKNVAGDIERAIQASNLGINPLVNGALIRLPIPELSGERRRELAKVAQGMAEHSRVGIRAARKDAMDALKQGQKDGDFSEDDFKRFEKDVQKKTDDYIAKIGTALEAKEAELQEV